LLTQHEVEFIDEVLTTMADEAGAKNNVIAVCTHPARWCSDPH
jgi:hypothetical protein